MSILNNECSFLVVGIVKNCQNTIAKDIERLKSSIPKYKSLEFLIIESDSSDQTILELSKLSTKIDNFKFISLGKLADKLPSRTQRLALCRNLYIEEIEKNYKDVSYVIISDLDDINKELNADSITSCFIRSDWDMCAANQNGPYYDIWALRHNLWNPTDPYKQLSFFKTFSCSLINKYVNIYSKMIKIPMNDNWIQVESAFGGIAIYKRHCFDFGARYKGIDKLGNEVCEHISFHEELLKRDLKLFINPKFINAALTEHSKVRTWRILYLIVFKLFK